MIEGGSVGGKAEAWNKGKNKQTDERIAKLAQATTGSNNPFYGHKHSEESLKKISVSKTLSATDIQQRLLARSTEFQLLTSLNDYESKQKQYLEFKCLTCGTIQPKTLQAFERGSRCYKCYPVSKSNWELNVYEYVKTICSDVVSGNRVVLSPKEIDVYVPSKKFGIECHGLYWHSEGSLKGVSDRHETINKIVSAFGSGIRLIQLFEDEWRDKREICESLILHRLGFTPTKIFARKCKLVSLSPKEQREFFNKSHLAGYTPASYAYGLVYNNEIIVALSVRKPRHAKKYQNLLEIARFATNPKTHVVGGLARLLSHIKEPLMTYVDRRIGTGKGYESCGFKLVDTTGVDYWYTDNVLRYDRFKYRAQDGKSEKQIAFEAKVSKIWGCGSFVYKRV
jgi:hypothetical protein